MQGKKREHSGYAALANAVVEQAAKDYLRALRSLKLNSKNTNALGTKKECEKFFRSEIMCLYTDVDGAWLIEALRKEVGYEE